MPHDDWPVEWDDFAKEVVRYLHLCVDHKQIVTLTWAGDRQAVMVPIEKWLEYTETEEDHA